MGQSCFSRITLCAKDSLPEEFTSEETLVEALTKFHASENDGQRCDVSISGDLLFSDSMVEFEMNSGKTGNLEFQVNLLVDYLKHKNISMLEFSASAYGEIESGSAYLGEEDF